MVRNWTNPTDSWSYSRNMFTISTLNKLLQALSCDLIIAPLLHHPIEDLRKQQARKRAEKQILYLKGTMNLEAQQPDSRFVKELLKREEERFLRESGTKLWEEL